MYFAVYTYYLKAIFMRSQEVSAKIMLQNILFEELSANIPFGKYFILLLLILAISLP